jgi:hypothetical protein
MLLLKTTTKIILTSEQAPAMKKNHLVYFLLQCDAILIFKTNKFLMKHFNLHLGDKRNSTFDKLCDSFNLVLIFCCKFPTNQ